MTTAQVARGNLQAVVQGRIAGLRAPSPDLVSQPGYGKQRGAMLRVTGLARAFPAPPTAIGTYN